MRELGFDTENNLVQKDPSDNFKHGPYGKYDLACFEVKVRNDDITWEEFQGVWAKYVHR